jgi:hypothetical protein
MPSTDTRALGALGISHDQSSQWQKLAAIPRDDFEADIADPMWRPTTAGLLERADARERGPLPALKGDEDALWLWGTLIDLEERGLLARDRVLREIESLQSINAKLRSLDRRRIAPSGNCWRCPKNWGYLDGSQRQRIVTRPADLARGTYICHRVSRHLHRL